MFPTVAVSVVIAALVHAETPGHIAFAPHSVLIIELDPPSHVALGHVIQLTRLETFREAPSCRFAVTGSRFSVSASARIVDSHRSAAVGGLGEPRAPIVVSWALKPSRGFPFGRLQLRVTRGSGTAVGPTFGAPGDPLANIGERRACGGPFARVGPR
jgi:hypothetical protein